MSTLEQLERDIEREAGRRDHVLSSLQKKKKLYKETTKDLKIAEKARSIVQEVALKTQEQLQRKISDLSSLALDAVFTEDPYQLELEFLTRRNKTEVDIWLFKEETGDRFDPLSSVGGGVVDIIAFSLRLCMLILKQAPGRKFLLMDEPFRFLSTDLRPLAGLMLKELSKKLEFQIVIITHHQELAAHADKTFHVSQKKGITNVQEGAES